MGTKRFHCRMENVQLVRTVHTVLYVMESNVQSSHQVRHFWWAAHQRTSLIKAIPESS